MASFHPDDQVVNLTRAPNPFQAHIWENALRDEGIRCQVVGDYLDVGIGDISGVQPEIWVRRQDVSQAEAVLQRYPQSRVDSGYEAAGPEVDREIRHESGGFDHVSPIGET